MKFICEWVGVYGFWDIYVVFNGGLVVYSYVRCFGAYVKESSRGWNLVLCFFYWVMGFDIELFVFGGKDIKMLFVY